MTTSTPFEEISDEMLRALLTTEQITTQRYMEEMERRKTVSKKIEDGGPAFAGGLFEPQHGGSNDREPWNPGMSLRDWFAGQALSGNLAAENMGEGWIERLRSPENARLMADRAYQMADAMLLARKSGGEA